MANLLDVTDATFEQEVLKSGKPVLVDFWAPWCGPCKSQGPILDQIAAARSDIKIVKLNVDENGVTSGTLGISGIPALILFRNGKIAGSKVGLTAKGALTEWIDQALAKPESEATTVEAQAEAAGKEEHNQVKNTIVSTMKIVRGVGYAGTAVTVGGAALLATVSGGLVPLAAAAGTAAYSLYAGYNIHAMTKAILNVAKGDATLEELKASADKAKADRDKTTGNAIRTLGNIFTAAAGVCLFGAAMGMGFLPAVGTGAVALYLTLSGAGGAIRNGEALLGLNAPKKKAAIEDQSAPAAAPAAPATPAPTATPVADLKESFKEEAKPEASAPEKVKEDQAKPAPAPRAEQPKPSL
jgi:thioredoxin 1